MEDKVCVHFIGFDPSDAMKWQSAVSIFGPPDFVHRYWDLRAAYSGERAPQDIMVFARGTSDDPPRRHSHDDSAFQ